ncbi:MAG: 1-deoxy-D-xylulose-5-phosphate reductoisomerase [Candidatus Omnitrophica bacterium]|nr:1-deoxy-D-xylulose-5-phosphate reductoisomerase [Candidatus Omnitrophota bacterium]
MTNIAVLGSTGSIGQSTLEVVRQFPDKFRVTALSTNSNVDSIVSQANEFFPRVVCIGDTKFIGKVKGLPRNTKLLFGNHGLDELVEERSIDKIILSISGSAALLPLLKAVKLGKTIALANKEALVMAGHLVMKEAKKTKANIFPVDSEQSAIWQCLKGEDPAKLKQVYLTASGGPFLKASSLKIKNATLKQVLRHPRWKMGKKITVDSATLINKGLELLEAMFLFNLSSSQIKILIHPQALVHSMVEFVDGVVMAQISATDMRIPIQYALSYPERLESLFPSADFYKLKQLDFDKPDFNKFPALTLAYRAANELGTMPCVLNAANEVCVEEFLKGKIEFISIARIIAKVLDKHKNSADFNLEDVWQADAWARNQARSFIERGKA